MMSEKAKTNYNVTLCLLSITITNEFLHFEPAAKLKIKGSEENWLESA